MIASRTLTALAVLALSLPGGQAVARQDHDTLPLGSRDLVEQRSTTSLAPGVTLTRIVRGQADPAAFWTVEMSVPSGPQSPDPDAAASVLKGEQSSQAFAGELVDAGFPARAEKVTTPAVTDFAGGTLGWRVRVGRFADQQSATAEQARLAAAGYRGSAFYSGWDPDRSARGPWHVDVLTIAPRRFTGTLDASFGPDLEQRETTSALARAAGAIAGVNAGFFVFDPAAGAPGDPAGAGVYGGRLLSEAISGRPALTFRSDARGSAVTRLRWTGAVSNSRGRSLPLDGINRVPTLIRNCGGTADDLPTAQPLHDVTCSDPDELVAFTPEFGPRTPAGEGVEAVLDQRGVVLDVRSPRGGALPPNGRSVQATGDLASALRAIAQPGQRLRLSTALRTSTNRTLPLTRYTSVVNGGPELVRDGSLHVTPATDGMVHPGDPSFYYGWVHKRNPRTFAGTDRRGRLVLVTADGRSTGSLGLSILETARVARSLGLVDAINLDGGGSTTMVVGGDVINDPSDSSGERPVGDALLLLDGAVPSH